MSTHRWTDVEARNRVLCLRALAEYSSAVLEQVLKPVFYADPPRRAYLHALRAQIRSQWE